MSLRATPPPANAATTASALSLSWLRAACAVGAVMLTARTAIRTSGVRVAWPVPCTVSFGVEALQVMAAWLAPDPLLMARPSAAPPTRRATTTSAVSTFAPRTRGERELGSTGSPLRSSDMKCSLPPLGCQRGASSHASYDARRDPMVRRGPALAWPGLAWPVGSKPWLLGGQDGQLPAGGVDFGTASSPHGGIDTETL